MAIRARIAAYPRVYPRISGGIPPDIRKARLNFSLQIFGLGNRTVLAEPLDRTQEVGGSNPPSSIDLKGLQMGTSHMKVA